MALQPGDRMMPRRYRIHIHGTRAAVHPSPPDRPDVPIFHGTPAVVRAWIAEQHHGSAIARVREEREQR